MDQDDNLIFTMDGTEHYRGECCNIFGKLCDCGGFMHYQPIYGGYYYKCELCMKEDI